MLPTMFLMVALLGADAPAATPADKAFHAAADEFEREMRDGHGGCAEPATAVAQARPRGRLYYRHRRGGSGPGVQ